MNCYEKKFETIPIICFCMTHEIMYKNKVLYVMIGVDMSKVLAFYF